MNEQGHSHSILIIDDEPDNFDVLEVLLDSEPYQLHYASSGTNALALLEKFHPDAILLDVMMPGMNGIEVCKQIRKQPDLQATPILVVTALTAKEDLARCFEVGADDFISKPVNGTELRARLRSALRIHQQYQEIQRLLKKLQGTNRELALFSTRLEQKVLERTQQLEKIIFFDQLTQLPSRPHLFRRLRKSLQKQTEQPHSNFALLYVDCDQFQIINGSLGYEVGDQLLLKIAKRLEELLRPNDLLSRLGGDDFCFLLEDLAHPDEAIEFTKHIFDAFQAPFQGDHYEIYVTASIGLVYCTPPPYQRPDAPLRDADTAVRLAKKQGVGRLQLFEPHMQTDHMERLQLENDLRRTLHNEGFHIHYQPILRLSPPGLVGVEALLRWKHPQRGMIPPGLFIPYTEETGLIVPIGLFVLRNACAQLKQWLDQGLPPIYLSINLSTRQFSYPSLLADLDQVLEETGLPPELLNLEITESALMLHPKQSIDITKQITKRKIHMSIDDFGTGYSSLHYLSQFPIDTIKLDRSFVKEIDTNPNNAEIVKAILRLGQALQKNVIAEGIETQEHLDRLREMGYLYGQGYHFARPVSPEDIPALFEQFPPPRKLHSWNKTSSACFRYASKVP